MAVITISGQYGAGARKLGKIISDQLGYTFADSSIIEMIAEAARVAPTWVENVEKEGGATNLTRVISKFGPKNLFKKILENDRGYVDEQLYLDYLVVIIAQIADEGNAVILGRGSQYILNDHEDAFHVLMIDQFENRVNFIEKNYKLERQSAVQVVTNEDKRRKNLYSTLGKADFDSPEIYHMVLNMERLEIEEAKNIVLDQIRI